MEKCTTCGQSRTWHDENETVHPFTDGRPANLGSRRERGEKGPAASATPAVLRWPFDPVLRQALVDKGILTVEDLGAAEEKIKQQSIIMGEAARG